MKSDTSLVAIKGNKHGLTITLLPGPMSDVLSELAERLTRTASFFRGGQVTLNVENPDLSASQLHAIEQLLRQHEITLRRIVTSDAQLAGASVALGLMVGAGESVVETESEPRVAREPVARVRASIPTVANPELDAIDTAPAYPGIVVRRTLRSGASVRHAGHVIVVGDVNPGAEVIAAGDVIVWGKLRGLVHAGAMGDNHAIVCALLCEPTQLRIGNVIARMPERKKRKSAPEMASIREGKIEVVEWS